MTEDLALKVAALKVVSDYTKEAYDESRKRIATAMERGDRKMARAGGVKLGAVSMSDPKPVARITDEQALTSWVLDNYPDAMESGYEVIGSLREIVDVLFEHAPHLLRKVARVDQDWLKAVRLESAKLGAVVGPGGEVDVPGLEVFTPDPVVSCKPSEEALPAVVELFRSRQLSLESLGELPGGAA